MFKAQVGISAIQYLQLARLKRASLRLAFEPQKSITEIAFEASFDSSEAFTRAFRREFALSPSEFRSQPEWQAWHSKFIFKPPSVGEIDVNVDIIDFEAKQVGVVEHKGHPDKVFDSAAKLIAWRKETGLSPIISSETYGVPYSDPSDTLPEEFRFDICGTVTSEVPENRHGVKNGAIPAGRCALAVHKGSHDSISDTVYYLYQQWLPTSGEALRDYPCFFRYLNFSHQVDECDLVTYVYLPLK